MPDFEFAGDFTFSSQSGHTHLSSFFTIAKIYGFGKNGQLGYVMANSLPGPVHQRPALENKHQIS